MSAPATLPYEFPDVPGLTLEAVTSAHLDEVAALEVVTGHRRPCDGDHSQWPEFLRPLPACAGDPLAHLRADWAADIAVPAAEGWCLRLAFQGRPLQYEIIELDGAARVADVRQTLRASRERPSWFWRETERPVFEALAAAGVPLLQVWIAPDRSPGGATSRRGARLAEHFGARDTGRWRSGGAACWAMATDNMSPFTGWPARRQVGFDQVDGRVRTWEATADDLPALRALINGTVPIARKALALRMVEEWWHLDRATLLLGARDGELRYARAIRPRAGAVAGFCILAGIFDEPEQRVMGQQVLAWCQAVGYATVTGFIQTAALPLPGVRALLAASPYRVVAEHRRFHEPFTEIEVPVPT